MYHQDTIIQQLYFVLTEEMARIYIRQFLNFNTKMFNCEASKQASGLGLMLSAKIYILSWKVWNKTFYCGSQTRIIADYTRNQIVFMRPLTYQNPVSKRVNSILCSGTKLDSKEDVLDVCESL